MSDNLDTQELENNDSFSMIISDKENKALENMILQMQEQSSILRNKITHNNIRIDAIAEHFKNVKNEIDYTQEGLKSRKIELENEINMKKINDMQLSRLKNENKTINLELDELHEYKNTHQNIIFLVGKKIEDVKSQINWDQNKLEIWLEESVKQDEDISLIKKYIKEDEGKFKELTLHINRLTIDRKEKLNEFEQITTDKITSQYELEKLAETYKSLKKERDTLIKQWDDLLKQMNSRDKDIEKLALEFITLKAEILNKQEELKNQLKFFESQERNNLETEKKIAQMERYADTIRHDLRKISNTRSEFKEELEILKRTVNSCAHELEKKRLESHEMKTNIEITKEKYEIISSKNDELVRNYDTLEKRCKSAGEYANEMDLILNNEEARYNLLEKQMKISRDKLFEATEDANNKKNEEVALKTATEGSVAVLRHLESRISKYDAEILRQEELIYNQDFEIQQLNRRIDTMQGNRGNIEKDELEKKVLELKETLEQRSEAYSILLSQLKTIEDEVRKVKKLHDTIISDKENYKNKIGELNLHIDNAQKELNGTIKRKENFLVESNVLKLDLESFKNRLAENDVKIFLNQEKKLNLEKAIKERYYEIQHHHEILTAQIKNAELDRSNLNLEYQTKLIEIEKLKRKHELLTVSMQPPEGEIIRSQAYYIIKAAQEKEELKIKGERLNTEILKSEQELHALENTVQLINERNVVYKNGFNKSANASQEKEIEKLSNECQELKRKQNDKRKSLKNKTNELKMIRQQTDKLAFELEQSKEDFQTSSKSLAHVKIESSNLNEKIKRATRNNQRLEKEILSSKSKSEDVINDKKDIVLKDLKNMNETITRIILAASNSENNIYKKVEAYFTENKIPMEIEDGVTCTSAQTSRTISRPTSSKYSSTLSSQDN